MSIVYAQNNLLGTTGDASTVTILLSACDSVAFQLAGTFVGTVQFEATTNGDTYASLAVTPAAGGATVTSATGTGSWKVTGCAGFYAVRARCSAFTSGVIIASVGAGANSVAAIASASDGQVLFMSGTDPAGDAGLTWDDTIKSLTVTGADPGVQIYATGTFDNFGTALFVDALSTDTTESVVPLAAQFVARATNATGITLDIHGIEVIARQSGNGDLDDGVGALIKTESIGSGSVGTLHGIENTLTTSGATTSVVGEYVSVTVSAGTTAEYNGIRITRPSVGGGGAAITTATGLYIENQDKGGSNFAIQTGTGPVVFGDVVKATGYKSSDGSSGVTAGPFTTISSITVKNGLVTALTGS